MKRSIFKSISSLFSLKQRDYNAAGTQDILYNWVSQPTSVDSLVKNNLTSLRARSREQVTNNDYAKRFINMVRTHVVGPDGFTFQARSSDPGGTLDTLANNAIEDTFKQWSRRDNCDISGRLSFKEMQRLIVSTVAEDGEVFIIKHKSGDYGYKLQLLDPEAIPVRYMDELKNIYFGIEFDEYHKPIAYHIQTSRGQGYQHAGEWYERIPADRVYHIFIPEKVGQKRGLPWMGTALLRMKMLNGYEDAALVNARIGASKMGFFTSPDGTQYQGDAKDTDGSIISEVEPGTLEQLPEGVNFQSFDPAYPSNEFDSFTKGALRGIASGLGVSYHKLGNNLEGVNYSSGRLGELEDRELWKAIQDFFIDNFLIPLYEDWLPIQLDRGMITVNGNPLRPERLEKYSRVAFQGRRWQWVDPQKEVVAQEMQINLGLRSRSDIIREQGRDPDDVWLEIQRETERMKDLGITESEQQEMTPERSINQRDLDELKESLKPQQPVFNITIPEARHETTVNVPESQTNLEAQINIPEIKLPEARMEQEQVNVEVNPTPVTIENNIEPPVNNVNIEPTPVRVENKIENNKTIEFERDGNGKIKKAKTKES